MLPGPFQIWHSGWVRVPPVAVSAENVCLWPYSVENLMKCVTFLGSLHWPSAGNDLGPGGVSYVELLILHELWAGERLQFEKAVPRCRRVDRPISVSAVPFGPGIDIRRSCKLLGAVLRALCALLGGLGRFIPCAIGAFFSLVFLLSLGVLCCVGLVASDPHRQCLPVFPPSDEQRSPKAKFQHRRGLWLQQDRPNLTRVVQIERMMIAVLQVRSLVGVKWKTLVMMKLWNGVYCLPPAA